jgi:heme/flavin dehydrogenase (mycofactocin system)
MTNSWFESVAEAQRRAQRVLPPSVHSAIMAGTERGVTMSDNVAAFDEIAVVPTVADKPATRDLSVTVMGQQLALPVIMSPTGVQAVHPDGELAVARAAAARGTAIGLSSFASKPLAEVVAANPQTFFQLYWCGTRAQIEQRVADAARTGAVGLILTLDWSFVHSRDWGSPYIPERLSPRAMLRYAPEAARRPRWLGRWARSHSLPDLTVPNMSAPGEPLRTFFEVYGEWMQTTPPTWSDIEWLRSAWNGPFMLKGVLRPDDARRAVDAGVTTISVSNHGGNNLDSTPAPIRVLPAIVAAAGDSAEIVLDGGIRRGTDVVKALALGARAVMIGRPYLWGLAANGQAGVENVLDVLRNGIDSTLLGLGRERCSEIGARDVIVPPAFVR